jgi:DNA-binding NtrC family response regulator
VEVPIRELVVDDDPKMVKTLVDIFRAKGHAPQGAHSGEEALEMLARMPFDCVVSDIRMGTMDGLTLFRAIRQAGHMLPVIFMTAYADEDMVRQGLQEGVVGAITKPFDMERLLAFLNRVRQAGSVLIIDDDPEFCLSLEDALEARGFAVEHVSNAAALDRALNPEHQTILLDLKFDRTTGLEILKAIRRRSDTVPVVLVTGYREEMAAEVEEALKKEVHACLDKPVDMDRLLAMLAELRHARLRRLLETPAVEGL